MMSEHRHDTEHEIAWLRQIGETHHRTARAIAANRAETKRALLLTYLAGAAKRSRWGSINREIVEREALRLLRRYTGGTDAG